MEKKPATSVIQLHTPTVAVWWYMVELWKESAIHVRWSDDNTTATAIALYLSSFADAAYPAGGAKQAVGWLAGTVDLSYWKLQSGYVFTLPDSTAKGSDIIPIAIHGTRKALIGITYSAVPTAPEGVELQVSGFNS